MFDQNLETFDRKDVFEYPWVLFICNESTMKFYIDYFKNTEEAHLKLLSLFEPMESEIRDLNAKYVLSLDRHGNITVTDSEILEFLTDVFVKYSNSPNKSKDTLEILVNNINIIRQHEK